MLKNLMVAAVAAMTLTVGAQADLFTSKETTVQLGYNKLSIETGANQTIDANGVAMHINTKRQLMDSKWSILMPMNMGYSSTTDMNGYTGTTTNTGSTALLDIGIGLGVGYEPLKDLTISALVNGTMIAEGDFYWWGAEGGADVTYEFAKYWVINAQYLVGSMKLQASTSATDTVSTSRAYLGIGYRF